MPHYELSKEQEAFVAEAEQNGYKVDLNYTNKYEKGQNQKCPAIHVSSVKTVSFRGRNIQWDKNGDGFVIYAPY